MRIYEGACNKEDSLFLSKPLVSHKVDKWSIDSKRQTTSKLSQMASGTLGARRCILKGMSHE
jgi:hypothetical protein